MPILKGAVTLSRFRVEAEPAALTAARKMAGELLRSRAFEPLDLSRPEERVHGFVEFADKESTGFDPGTVHEAGRALFTFRVDELRIPSALVKSELERWIKKFQQEQERPPGRREKHDAKQEIRHTLRSRSPVLTRLVDVAWDQEAGRVEIWAGARKAVDEVQSAVEQLFKVKLLPQAPAVVAMGLGMSEKSLAPTAALSLPDEEGGHGRAS